MRFGLALAALTLVTASTFLAACASARVAKASIPVPPQVVQSAMRFQKEYTFAPGDQMEILVRRVPEVSRTVAVRPDGLITLPVINDITAAGLTRSELNAKLTASFSARLENPEVTVIPTVIRQPVVYVVGDVKSPMAVPLRDAPTAIQAIALAGGFLRTALPRQVALVRVSEAGFVQATTVETATTDQPSPYMTLRALPLKADDIIFVPESGRSQLARFIDDVINRPLTGISAAVGTYVNFRLIELLNN